MTARPSLTDRFLSPLRRRAEARVAIEAEARALLEEQGRVGALHTLYAGVAAARTGAERRRIWALHAAVRRLAPPSSGLDVATRLHYAER